MFYSVCPRKSYEKVSIYVEPAFGKTQNVAFYGEPAPSEAEHIGFYTEAAPSRGINVVFYGERAFLAVSKCRELHSRIVKSQNRNP